MHLKLLLFFFSSEFKLFDESKVSEKTDPEKGEGADNPSFKEWTEEKYGKKQHQRKTVYSWAQDPSYLFYWYVSGSKICGSGSLDLGWTLKFCLISVRLNVFYTINISFKDFKAILSTTIYELNLIFCIFFREVTHYFLRLMTNQMILAQID